MMKPEHRLLLACFLVTLLFRCTMESPSDDHPHHDRRNPDAEIPDLTEDDETADDSSRWNHARMRDPGVTTLGYDEWWFLTTPRPFISYRDFPGKSGVASWKEISPGAAADNRQSRKVASPTAEGVSSGAESRSWGRTAWLSAAVLGALCHGFGFLAS